MMIDGDYGFAMQVILLSDDFDLHAGLSEWTITCFQIFGKFLANVPCAQFMTRVSNNINQRLEDLVMEKVSKKECSKSFQTFVDSLSEEEKFWGHFFLPEVPGHIHGVQIDSADIATLREGVSLSRAVVMGSILVNSDTFQEQSSGMTIWQLYGTA